MGVRKEGQERSVEKLGAQVSLQSGVKRVSLVNMIRKNKAKQQKKPHRKQEIDFSAINISNVKG